MEGFNQTEQNFPKYCYLLLFHEKWHSLCQFWWNRICDFSLYV